MERQAETNSSNGEAGCVQMERQAESNGDGHLATGLMERQAKQTGPMDRQTG